MRNIEGKTTNPSLYAGVIINVITGEAVKIYYSVQCFENKETKGYFYETYTNYTEAKKAYDDLFLNHVEEIK